MVYTRNKFFLFFVSGFFALYSGELRWDWSKINTKNISFPRDFYWGVSDSALQTEGMESAGGKLVEDSWTAYEHEKKFPLEKRVGYGCHRWTLYKNDVQLIKDCHMNMYRFSIPWNKIEPEMHKFDEAAMQHYVDLVDELRRHGIEPMPVLFHHTVPEWQQKKGGFEDERDNFYFIRFAEYVFNHLHKKVKYWVVMNEPVAYAIEAYWRKNYPPAKQSFRTAGLVAYNLLNLCVETSIRLKKIDKTCKVGIIHIINPLDCFHKWNPIEQISARIFDNVVNNSTIEFFKTGKFNWAFFVRGYNKQAVGCLDFIGINYYTHTLLCQKGVFNIGPSHRPNEKLLTKVWDDGRGSKVIYPEGLYRAIRRASVLNIPIFITENGSSTDDPELTKEYLEQHLYALSQARKDGYPVVGYLLWTLTDSFGWNKGYQAKHGMYAVDFKTQKRTLRPAFNDFIHTIEKLRG